MTLAEEYQRVRGRLAEARSRLESPDAPADDAQALAELRRAEGRHDAVTRAHTRKVAHYARHLAEAAGFGAGRAARLHAAMTLHDVGKMRVPESVLNHPGRLDEAQRAEMQRHTIHGADMLLDASPGPLGVEAAELALTHHERVDGKGYHGMRGGELSAEQRIAAIADVFEALTARRPYKEPMSPDKALAIMSDPESFGADRAFDGELLAIMREIGPDLHAQAHAAPAHAAPARPAPAQPAPNRPESHHPDPERPDPKHPAPPRPSDPPGGP